MVFDGIHFSENSLQFVKRLNELSPILLTGVFLPSIDYSEVMVYYLSMQSPIFYPDIVQNVNKKNENIEKFKAFCAQHQIECRVHDEYESNALAEIQKETRFADVLVLSSDTYYDNLGTISQKEYLQETLHKAECPIILLPENCSFPESLVIAYDGSESSVFALKQFAYLFPELSGMSTLVVYAAEEGKPLPYREMLQELAARHFPDATGYTLEADPKKYFATWMANKGNALLITGSFGRSTFSELLNKNFSMQVLQDHRLPVFVAHK